MKSLLSSICIALHHISAGIHSIPMGGHGISQDAGGWRSYVHFGKISRVADWEGGLDWERLEAVGPVKRLPQRSQQGTMRPEQS